MKNLFLVLLGLWLTGCTSQATVMPTTTAFPSTAPSFTPQPSLTSTPEPTPTSTATLIPYAGVCSPLNGIGLNELHSITSNNFSYPSPFSDLGHPGVDLAFFQHGSFSTMVGLPVQSVLPGRVVQVVDDRFPYGNMILIETPLNALSTDLIRSLSIPTPIPEENIDAWSTCAKDMSPIAWSEDSKSLYLLYSHLESRPDFQVGDAVGCGQIIGAVGITGNSVAEHLHLEMRIGPSNAQFGSIATYTEQATAEERYNYCIWSISGRFQAIDPAIFWKDQN